jgi:hypothetical protein
MVHNNNFNTKINNFYRRLLHTTLCDKFIQWLVGNFLRYWGLFFLDDGPPVLCTIWKNIVLVLYCKPVLDETPRRLVQYGSNVVIFFKTGIMRRYTPKSNLVNFGYILNKKLLTWSTVGLETHIRVYRLLKGVNISISTDRNVTNLSPAIVKNKTFWIPAGHVNFGYILNKKLLTWSTVGLETHIFHLFFPKTKKASLLNIWLVNG